MKKSKHILSSLIISLLLTSCFISKKVVVNYAVISVPEEGGINFTQFTRDDENVVGPYIGMNEYTGMLQWYAAPFIAVSPDGLKLAYSAQKNNANNIYIKNTTGGRSTVQRTFRNNILDMSFSPDGKKLAFTDWQSGNKNVYMINSMEGAAVQQITSTNSDELGPYFAPDGKSIFFSKSEGSTYYIWNFNLETSLLTQYSQGFTPCIAPDGENMIITRNNPDNQRGEIWMINLKTGMETLILNDPVKGFSSPHISPDGKKIVLVGTTGKTDSRPQNLDLYSVNIDGTMLTQLTFHPGHDVSPQWSPDGKSVYFISQRGNETGKYNVWRMENKN